MHRVKLTGLAAAAHTPFKADGSLNLAVVERQAQLLMKNGVRTAFVCGSSGESLSLSLDERRQLAQRWVEVTRGTTLQIVVHVGSNCIPDARTLAAQAEQLGVQAISALAPSYFKPRTLGILIEWCAAIAGAAPKTPFYYYDVPVLTNVNFSMPAFLREASDRIPTLNGIKFTNSDLMAYELCLEMDGGEFDIPWGIDQCLLSALCVGARGAIGTSYGFAAPLYQRILDAFAAGDLAAAREEQSRAVRLTELLASYQFLGASKAVMKMLGVDVGPVRLPNTYPTAEQASKLQGDLEQLGFFDWIKPAQPQPSGRRA